MVVLTNTKSVTVTVVTVKKEIPVTFFIYYITI